MNIIKRFYYFIWQQFCNKHEFVTKKSHQDSDGKPCFETLECKKCHLTHHFMRRIEPFEPIKALNDKNEELLEHHSPVTPKTQFSP